LKMINSNNILVNGIIDIWNPHIPFFFPYIHILKITYRIIGHISEKAICNELESVFLGHKFFSEPIQGRSNIRIGRNGGFIFGAIGKLFRYLLFLNLYGSYGIATDIGKAIVVGVVIATFQKNAIGKPVTDLKVNAYGGYRVRQYFFMICG